MNYGEIKTAVFSSLRELGEEASLFDFGESINAALLQLTSMLPLEAIPELMVTKFIDRSGSVLSEGAVQLPERFYSLEFVQFATSRAGDGTVTRSTARIVPPEEFELLTSLGTAEKIASVTGQLVRFSPTPVGSGNEGDPKAIKMVYKRRPVPYSSLRNVHFPGSCIDILQHNDSPHTLDLYDWNTAPVTAANLGFETVEDIIGCTILAGRSSATAGLSYELFRMTVVDAGEDTTVQVIISEDDEVPPVDDVTGTTTLQPSLILPRQQDETGKSVQSDDQVPDITEKWHHHIVDLAVARILISLGQYNPAAARLQLLTQKFQAMGHDIFFTMPEVPAEKGGR